LSKSGKFIGKARLECSLDNLGPRGDDKARRIRFDQKGYMNITGVPFNYNLTANSTIEESFYQFAYNRESNTWVFMQVR
jgi:hypothetical protein